MTNIPRRDFIAISSAVAGSSIISSRSIGQEISNTLATNQQKYNESDRTPTFCEMCFWKCSAWVIKDEKGEPWKVIGNEKDIHSNGRLCTRGTAGLGSYIDEDRLKTPMIRVGERGSQSFKEVTWEEAFEYIANKLEIIKNEHGPESVAMFKHGIGGTFFHTLLKGYGASVFTHPSYAQCRGARQEAFKLTFGEGVGSPERTDMENAQCIVLIGSHLGENLHNSQVQEFASAIDKGASIITVDPRFSVAAGKSKYWLPIKPGTDLALILAWIHVLIDEGIYHSQFVEEHCNGLEELKEHVKDLTPEWAYPITTIKPEVIRETAREFAKNKPASIIHPSRHVSWDGKDTQRLRSIAILNALLGNWGAKGGFCKLNKIKLAKYPVPEFPKPKYNWRDLVKHQFPLASTPPSSSVRDLTIEGHFKSWFIYATNIIQSLPHPEKTKEAINKLDMLVVIDTMPAEITGWADVILPECTYVERHDEIRTSTAKKSQVAVRIPAFKPKWDSKPAWWIAKNLAKKMNLEKYFPWESIEDYIDFRMKSIGSSYEEIKKKGLIELPNSKPLYASKNNPLKFKTPSGKVELYSEKLKALGFDPLPIFSMPDQPQENYYRLIYGRSPAHTFGKTINNPLLNELMPENEIWINADIAEQWKLKNGQYIKLKNQDGIISNKIKVKATQMIRHDAVYMIHGFGHNAPKLKKANGAGADDQSLITIVNVDPIMGSTGFRSNFVTFLT